MGIWVFPMMRSGMGFVISSVLGSMTMVLLETIKKTFPEGSKNICG